MATVIEQLRASGAAEDEVDRASAMIAKVLPVGRAIVLNDQMLAAARSGDVALLVTKSFRRASPSLGEGIHRAAYARAATALPRSRDRSAGFQAAEVRSGLSLAIWRASGECTAS